MIVALRHTTNFVIKYDNKLKDGLRPSKPSSRVVRPISSSCLHGSRPQVGSGPRTQVTVTVVKAGDGSNGQYQTGGNSWVEVYGFDGSPNKRLADDVPVEKRCDVRFCAGHARHSETDIRHEVLQRPRRLPRGWMREFGPIIVLAPWVTLLLTLPDPAPEMLDGAAVLSAVAGEVAAVSATQPDVGQQVAITISRILNVPVRMLFTGAVGRWNEGE